MSKLLQKYGYRVQKSAFEMHLTALQYQKLSREISGIVGSDDNVRIYKLHSSSLIKVWGDIPKIEDEDYYFF